MTFRQTLRGLLHLLRPVSRTFANTDLRLHDLHNHLLPNLDDGPSSISGSIQICRGLTDLGFRVIVATPHHNHSQFATPTAEMRQNRLAEVIPLFADLQLDITTGAEIMLQGDYLPLLETDQFPSFHGVFLVEFPHQPGIITPAFENVLFHLRTLNRRLMFAHPERHPDFQRHPEMLRQMHLRGAFLQLDLLSLMGRNGENARQVGWRMIEEGLADIAATDIHRPSDLTSIEFAMDELHAHSPGEFIRLLATNPAHLVQGHPERLERHEHR